MIRMYLVDKQATELANCIRARICQLSGEFTSIKGMAAKEELNDRITTLEDILEISNESGDFYVCFLFIKMWKLNRVVFYKVCCVKLIG